MELEHGKEEERKQNLASEEARKQAEDELRQLQIDKNRGFNPRGKMTLLNHENIKHEGIIDHPGSLVCENVANPTLIYTDEVNFALERIIQDIIAVKNSENMNKNGDCLVLDEENDGYSP